MKTGNIVESIEKWASEEKKFEKEKEHLKDEQRFIGKVAIGTICVVAIGMTVCGYFIGVSN